MTLAKLGFPDGRALLQASPFQWHLVDVAFFRPSKGIGDALSAVSLSMASSAAIKALKDFVGLDLLFC